MKQILVATDFSASASNAMDYAMALAKILNMEVCAINAIPSMEGVGNNMYNAFFIDDYHATKRQALKDWAARYSTKEEYSGVEVTTTCIVGNLKSVITDYVAQHHVELLVMGLTGATGIMGIVGSNASTMVEAIKIPTLFIPIESKFSPSPVLTLATDYETRLSADDVNAINEMVTAFGSGTMQVVYVAEKADSKNKATEEAKLQELIKGASLEFNYINNANTTNGILTFIAEKPTDILCLVKHHHNIVYRLFTRSTINQVMNRSVKAILVLHE